MRLKYKLMSVLFIINSLPSFAQTKSDLYIFYKKSDSFVRFQSVTDSTEYILYSNSFNVKFQKIALNVSDSGILTKGLLLDSQRNPSISYKHENVTGNNNPKLIPKSYIINKLTYTQLTYQVDPTEYAKVLTSYLNIYIIEEDEVSGSFFIGRKVERGPPMGGL